MHLLVLYPWPPVARRSTNRQSFLKSSSGGFSDRLHLICAFQTLLPCVLCFLLSCNLTRSRFVSTPFKVNIFFFCLTLTRPVWMLFYFIRLQRQDLFVCTHCSSTTAFIFVFTCCVCLETFSAVLFRCIFAACNWRGGNAISSQDGLSSCSKFGNWPVRAYLKSTLMETVYISISLPHGFYFAGLFIFWILCYCTMLFSCPLLPPKL